MSNIATKILTSWEQGPFIFISSTESIQMLLWQFMEAQKPIMQQKHHSFVLSDVFFCQYRVLNPEKSSLEISFSLEKFVRSMRELGLPTLLSQDFLQGKREGQHLKNVQSFPVYPSFLLLKQTPLFKRCQYFKKYYRILHKAAAD